MKETAKPHSVVRTTSAEISTELKSTSLTKILSGVPGVTEREAGSIRAPEVEMFAMVPPPSM